MWGLAALAVAVGAGGPAAACRLALILALDVSGSVDAREYRLQLDGLAEALADPEVRSAILALSDAPVDLAVFEWSGAAFQRQIIDRTTIDGPALDAAIGRLRGWQRISAPEATGLGAALEVAAAQLADGPACWRHVVDISSDGKNNDWPSPRQVHLSGATAGLTVNALAVGLTSAATGGIPGLPELVAYLEAEVIRGADAFVETASGYEDYAEAMKRKLLRELTAGLFASSLPIPRLASAQ
ncbi:DUF1194 domain-containing protein [Rhodobacteraceae bacterium MCCB 386]|nr:DUF1194 domain-containing protein [Roseitranquillus sediminis]